MQQNSATSLLYYKMVILNFLNEKPYKIAVSLPDSPCIRNDRSTRTIFYKLLEITFIRFWHVVPFIPVIT